MSRVKRGVASRTTKCPCSSLNVVAKFAMGHSISSYCTGICNLEMATH